MMSLPIAELASLVEKVPKKSRTPSYMAEHLLNELHISRPAVPVQLLAEGLGIRIVETELDSDISGALITQGENKIIAINSKHGKNRRRFTLAHEIGHYVLKHTVMDSHVDRHFTVIRRDKNSSLATDDFEIQANKFAAELLMPRDFILREFSRYGSFDDELIEKLSEKYVVSPLAFRIRLSNLGFYAPIE